MIGASPDGLPDRPEADGLSAGPLAVLQRIRVGRGSGAPEVRPGERCEMCAEPIADDHSHVVNVGTRSLLCTCRACYLLFTRKDASLAFRAVPDRYLSLPAETVGAQTWNELQIPVGIVFFFRNSALDRMVSFYPSPAGATESELPLGAWQRVVSQTSVLSAMAPDVEALLVRRTDEPTAAPDTVGHIDAVSRDDNDIPTEHFESFLVPIDACYELVGQLRRLWRGFDGGQQAHAAIDGFFDRVRARSRPAGGTEPAVVKAARRDFGPARVNP